MNRKQKAKDFSRGKTQSALIPDRKESGQPDARKAKVVGIKVMQHCGSLPQREVK